VRVGAFDMMLFLTVFRMENGNGKPLRSAERAQGQQSGRQTVMPDGPGSVPGRQRAD
jgi:hypothetical protein